MGMKKYAGTVTLADGSTMPISVNAGSSAKALSIAEKKLKARKVIYTAINMDVVNEADLLPED